MSLFTFYIEKSSQDKMGSGEDFTIPYALRRAIITTPFPCNLSAYLQLFSMPRTVSHAETAKFAKEQSAMINSNHPLCARYRHRVNLKGLPPG